MDKRMCTVDTRIRYCDVDPDFQLRHGALWKYLHQTAVDHREAYGLHDRALRLDHRGWIVRNMVVQLREAPGYDEILKIESWIPKIEGIRVYRAFRLFISGVMIGEALGEWALYDLQNRRVCRLLHEMRRRIPLTGNPAIEARRLFSLPEMPSSFDAEHEISVRPGDYDTNAHINHTTYMDYLETTLAKTLSPDRAIGECRMQFKHEGGIQTGSVLVALRKEEKGIRFRISTGDTELVRGVAIPPQRVSFGLFNENMQQKGIE